MSSSRSNDSSSAEETVPLPGTGATFAAASRRLNRRYAGYLDQVTARRRLKSRRILIALSLIGVAVTALLGFGLTRGLVSGWVALTITIPMLGVPVVAAVMEAIRESRSPMNQVRSIVQSGVPVNAFLIQANPALFKPQRQRLPCLALICFQSEVAQDKEYMRFLARKIYALKNTRPADPDSRYIASLTTDERMLPQRRRALPLSFTDGSTIYCTDLWVRPSYLQGSSLQSDILPCIAEPGSSGGIELVPWWLLAETEKPLASATPENESRFA